MNTTKIYKLSELPFIELYQTLNTKGIPKIININETSTYLEVTFEYIPGTQIDISYNTKQPTKELYNDFTRLCNIVNDLHLHGIIHRDIKPQNIIKTPNGELYLIDFGISRLYKVDKNQDTTLFGTEYYAAPEQYGFSQTDSRTCIYQIGKTFATIAEDYKISPQFEAKLDKCIAFDPKDRYQSINEILKTKLVYEQKKYPKISPLNLFIMFMLAVFTFGAFLCAFDETLTPQLGQSLGYLLMVFSADLLYYYYEFGSKREYSNKHKLYACFGWWTLFCVLVLWLYESLVAIFT